MNKDIIFTKFKSNEDFIEKLPSIVENFSGKNSRDFIGVVNEKRKDKNCCDCEQYFYESLFAATVGYSWTDFKIICRYIALRLRVTYYFDTINKILAKVNSPIFKYYGEVDPNTEEEVNAS